MTPGGREVKGGVGAGSRLGPDARPALSMGKRVLVAGTQMPTGTPHCSVLPTSASVG